METDNSKHTFIAKTFSVTVVDVILIALVFISFFISLLFALENRQLKLLLSPAGNFEECISQSGSIIKDGFPSVCITHSGQEFIQDLTDEEIRKLEEKDTAAPEVSVPSEWKEYKNPDFGIELRYPPSWKEPGEKQISTRKIVEFENKLTIEYGTYYSQDLGRELTFNEFVELNRPPARTVIDYTLDFVKGKRFLYQQGGGLAETLIAVPKGSQTNILTLSFKAYPTDTNEQKLYYQLLTSFKFSTENKNASEDTPVCVVDGCSSEICQEAGKEPASSVCVYKEEYACYKSAKCEVQPNGTCGWTPTEELKSCLTEKQTVN